MGEGGERRKNTGGDRKSSSLPVLDLTQLVNARTYSFRMAVKSNNNKTARID